MKKRIFLCLTAIIICLFALGLTASAEMYGDLTYSVSYGEATITDCNTSASGNLVIPGTINGYPVTKIGSYAFSKCNSLTEFVIPDSVTSIGNWAFSNCRSLTSVTIGKSVTSIGNYAFQGCESLTEIIVNKENTSYSSDSGILFNKNKTKLVCYPEAKSEKLYEIPDSVTSIGNRAFSGCESLTEIAIPDSVTSIGNRAFYGCESLTEIIIPDSVTSIGEGTFQGCESLTEFVIPDSVTSIGNQAFSDCRSLTEIVIPDSVTSIDDYAFSRCESLTSVTIGNSVTSIGDYAFRYCENLTEIVIPDSVTSIGDYAFYACNSLTQIVIPDSVTTIGFSTFSDCYSLTEISLPKISAISNGTFYNCHYLSKIYIPKTVKYIYSDAFYGCYSLETVYFEGTESEWNAITIKSGNDCLTDANVIFNSQSLENCVLSYKLKGGTATIQSEIFEKGETISVSEIVPTKENCIFLGWATEENVLEAIYQPGDEITPDGSLTLYAVWEEIPVPDTATTSNIVSGHIVLFVEAKETITTDKMLHIALYSENKRLIDYIIVPVVKEFDETNVVFKDNSDVKYAKIFLWNTADNITPISMVEEVTIR